MSLYPNAGFGRVTFQPVTREPSGTEEITEAPQPSHDFDPCAQDAAIGVAGLAAGSAVRRRYHGRLRWTPGGEFFHSSASAATPRGIECRDGV